MLPNFAFYVWTINILIWTSVICVYDYHLFNFFCIRCLRFPSSFEDLTAMTSYLTEYKSDNLWHVIVIFCFAYLYKQAFAIPGSVFLVSIYY